MNTLFGPAPIKAISLWQPWATLVALGYKIDETRHWRTEYRGPLAICAAKVIDVAGAPHTLCREVLGEDWRYHVPTGAVLAVTNLAGCRQTGHGHEANLTAANLAAGNFAPGRFAWWLDDVRPLIDPLPIVGRQGLFNWTPPENIDDLLGPALNHLEVCRRAGWLTRDKAAA